MALRGGSLNYRDIMVVIIIGRCFVHVCVCVGVFAFSGWRLAGLRMIV